MTVVWRDDIDALQFAAGEGQNCFVHRLAFRALTGLRDPSAADCISCFELNSAAFEAAAKRKIARAGDQHAGNFHLTSRDVQGHI
jgi:hypothetical protein